MKAGFAYMNSVTVLQASQGLAQYILDQRQSPVGKPAKDLTVVIGYDARYNSEKFARLSAAAFLAKGFSVLWYGQIVHTPMVSTLAMFSCRCVGEIRQRSLWAPILNLLDPERLGGIDIAGLET